MKKAGKQTFIPFPEIALFPDTDSEVLDNLAFGLERAGLQFHVQESGAEIPVPGSGAVIVTARYARTALSLDAVSRITSVPVYVLGEQRNEQNPRKFGVVPWRFFSLPGTRQAAETFFSEVLKKDLLFTNGSFFLQRSVLVSSVENLDSLGEYMDTIVRGRLPEKTGYSLKTIVVEMADNAIQHGNRNNPEKKVDIQVLIKENKIVVRIADEGKGFPYSRYLGKIAMADNVRIALEKGDEQLGGLGIPMAKRFFDVVDFKENGSCVYLEKHFQQDITFDAEDFHVSADTEQ